MSQATERKDPAHRSNTGNWLVRLRRYWVAIVTVVFGVVISFWIARNLAASARAQDEARFAAESQLLTGMIEQKMERYEAMLARVRDMGSYHRGEPNRDTWLYWISHVLGGDQNYPALRMMVVAPKVTPERQAEFEARARASLATNFSIITGRTNAEYWLPVWRQKAWGQQPLLVSGRDLAEPGPWWPALSRGMGTRYGWVAPEIYKVPTPEGGEATVFWLVQSMQPEDELRLPAWSIPGETRGQQVQRHASFRRDQATGVVAILLDGDAFIREFNQFGGEPRLHVQLFAATNTAAAATLVNPGQPAPSQPLMIREVPMRWYGRTWIARWSTTPRFEADSVRYRSPLALALGIPLTLLVSCAMGWQTYSRNRVADLADKLGLALARQEQLSADLHDGTLQSIYALGLGLRRCSQLLRTDASRAAERLDQCAASVQQVILELRQNILRLAHDQAPAVPLAEALAAIARAQESLGELRVELDLAEELARPLGPQQTLHLVNIAREAISNSLRHGDASLVRIALQRVDEGCMFSVIDNGKGFAPGRRHPGVGLKNIEQRARALGGNAEVTTATGGGVAVHVRFP